MEGEFRNYAIGGVNLQMNQYIQEVEMYDESYSVWKYYKNLPNDAIGQNGPDSGCIGKMRNSII